MCNGGGACGYVPNNILEVTKVVDVSGRGEPIYSHTIQVRGRSRVQTTRCSLVVVATRHPLVLFCLLTPKLMMPKKEFELFKVGGHVTRVLLWC